LAQLVGIGGLACTAVSTRPHFGPLPGAVVDTLGAGPGAVIGALASALETHGLRVRAVSPAEGYLETAWFDPTSQRSVGGEHRHVGRVFRMRAYADSVPPGRSELVIETVFRRTADPSAPGREEEIVAPPGHPGDSLTQLVLDSLRKRFPR
jgi:hypothetical protein